MATDIKITYINKSKSYHQFKPAVLVYMQPTKSNFAAESTAWQVIKNIGYNSWHKFTYSLATSVQVIWDNNGQSDTFTMNTINGKNYSFEETDSGFSLVESGSSIATNQFEVINNVNATAGISVVALKDGHPIQIKHQVYSKQNVTFTFNPKLYFGISSKYKVGDIISPTELSEEFTEISLSGSSSLRVIMNSSINGYTFMTSYD